MHVLGEEEVLSGAGFLEGVFLDFLELVGVEDGEKCAEEVGAGAGERTDACSGGVALVLVFMLAVEGVGRAAAAVLTFTTGSSLRSGGGERERGRWRTTGSSSESLV